MRGRRRGRAREVRPHQGRKPLDNLAALGQDRADIRIAFWIERSDPRTGMIEDTDSFAELTELASEVQNLRDVRVGQTVAINPVDIDFSTGVATTSLIRVTTTPNVTPTPSPTSTP